MTSSIISAARQWLGTPYHHAADLKGIGVDCGMLIVRIFVDLGLVPPFDPRPYTHDWHLHRGEEVYLGFIEHYTRPIKQPKPGAIILFRYGRCFSHGGIVTECTPLRLIHAFHPAGMVVEEILQQNLELYERPYRFFEVTQP